MKIESSPRKSINKFEIKTAHRYNQKKNNCI